MEDNIEMKIDISLDDQGMIGRECPECKNYFKLKPGTGMPISDCNCPYCDYGGDISSFNTQAQIQYVESIAMNHILGKIVKPSLKKLYRAFKELERISRHSLIQFKVKTRGLNFHFPIKYYTEKELETKLTCDGCKLEFAIYGVFSRCPDCKEINAFLIYERSLDVIKKQLNIFSKPEIPTEILSQSLSSVLTSCISAFDGLGKELKKRKPHLYPKRPKNLFQNLILINEKLDNLISNNHSNFDLLVRMFQVRHIYEHNMGVIDDDFSRQVPEYSNMLGRKYILNLAELNDFLISMKDLGLIVKIHFNKN